MDGRCLRRRKAAYRLLPPAFGLLFGLGCVHQSAVTSDAVGQSVPLEDAKSLPRHEPHAATCVAFGDLHAQVAEDPHRPPMEQDQIRQQACKDYQQALKIDATCAAAYLGLGRLYQQTGDYDRALATYQKGLTQLPKAAPLWYDLAVCQARHKEWEPALTNLKMAADLEPDNVTYGKMRGFCLAQVGRYDDSFDCFKKVTSEAQAHYDVARALHHAQEDDACRRHLMAALALQPNMEQAKHLLADLDKPAHEPGKPAVARVGFEQVDSDKGPAGGDPENEWVEKLQPLKK